MLFRIALGLFFASALTLAAQQPPAATPADQSQTARFGAAASGVVVDVVVRDKKGRPVSNLTAADFAIFEDGVRQKVVAFEPYTPADVPAPCRRRRARGWFGGGHAQLGAATRGGAADHRAGVGSTGARRTGDCLQGGAAAGPDQGAGGAGRRLSDRHDAADNPAVHDRQPAAWRGGRDARHGRHLVDEARDQPARRRRRARFDAGHGKRGRSRQHAGGISRSRVLAGDCALAADHRDARAHGAHLPGAALRGPGPGVDARVVRA